MTPRSPQRRWWKTALKVAAFLLAAALSLAVLAAALLSWTGRRDWARVKADLTARGEALSLAELIPPSIPDAQNFFADPMWDELADLVDAEENGVPVKRPRLPQGQRQLDAFNRPLTPEERETLRAAFPEFAVPDDATIMGLVHATFKSVQDNQAPESEKAAQFLLAVTDLADPILSRLHALADRPGARLGLEVSPSTGFAFDSASYHTRLAQFLQARIWAETTLGRTADARRDLLTLLRIPETLGDEPLMVSLLIQMATASMALDALEGALATEGWTDGQLEEIGRRLEGADYPGGVAAALRGERGWQNLFFEQLMARNSALKGNPSYEMWSGPGPSVWMGVFGAADQAKRNVLYQNWIDVLDASFTAGLNARTFEVFSRDLKELKENWWIRIRYPVAAMGIPNMNGIVSVAAQLQDQTALARAVCALRRYHLAQGVYPVDLNVLVPTYLPAVPTDISTLRPLFYRREGSGFRLWTPGWNERDDGGDGDDIVWGKAGRR